MKKTILLLVPMMCAGCLSVDDIAALTANPGLAGRPTGPAPVGGASYQQTVFADGYRKGYNAGYYDGDRGVPFRGVATDRRAPGASNAFYEGYNRGYETGYRDARRLGYYNFQPR